MQQCHTIYGPDKISATVWYVGVIAKTAKNAHSFVSLCGFFFFFFIVVVVGQYCTQMVQLTRLHNTRNLHKCTI